MSTLSMSSSHPYLVRPNRFRITVVARHKESVRFTSQADNNFWRLLAEQGASLANKHRDEHPLIESHDPVVGEYIE